LHRQWNLADLVEKQRTLIGQFEPADLLVDGSGECAFLVAE